MYTNIRRPKDIQDLQIWQDKINEVLMVLETNLDIMSSLRRFFYNFSAPERLSPRAEKGVRRRHCDLQ